MSIKKLLPFLLLIALISVSPALMGQTDPDDPSVDDPAVPVDGGISMLLAVGAAYGTRRLYRKVGTRKE